MATTTLSITLPPSLNSFNERIPVIPPNRQQMIPVLFTPDHQAILYFGWWNQVISNSPDPAQLIGQMPLIQNPKLKIFGKEATSHRSIGFFSNQSEGYKFSGQLMKSQPLLPELIEIMDRVNSTLATPESGQTPYNGILVNYYANGSEYISAHSDAETELSPSGVFALSMGLPRNFEIIAKKPGQVYYYRSLSTNQWHQGTTEKKNQLIYVLPTPDHSVMLMWGSQFQKLFKHAVPVSKIAFGPRISWTWRSHTK